MYQIYDSVLLEEEKNILELFILYIYQKNKIDSTLTF